MKFFTTVFLLFCFSMLFGQTSSNMTLLGQIDVSPSGSNGVFYNDIWGFTDPAGNEYAVVGSPFSTHFFDVTDPASPTLIETFTNFTGSPSSNIWRDYKYYDGYVYGVCDRGSEGLIIFDVSDIANSNITYTQDNDDFNRAHNVFVDVPNARLYVLGANAANVIVYDLSTNPENPGTSLGFPKLESLTGGYVHDMYVKNNIAYTSHGNTGLYIYDFTDPANPIYIESKITGAYNHSSWTTDDDQYIVWAEETAGRPLGISDISDLPGNGIANVSSFKSTLEAPAATNSTPHNPFIIGNDLVVISYYDEGVQIWDISDKLNPFRTAHYDTNTNTGSYPTDGVWGVYPYLPSGNIIASDIQKGLYIFSTSVFVPIELSKFVATLENNQILLEWATASETNNDKFILERSADGIYFEAFAEVKGAGDSEVETNYSLKDFKPFKGYNYYRIQQVDFNGKKTVSEVLQVYYKQALDFRISPSLLAAGEPLHIFMYEEIETNIDVQILTMNGVLVHISSNKLMNREILIPTEGISPGAYIINLSFGDGYTASQKIIIE